MVLAIASQKGGTGKSSTSISIGAGFSRKGQKVLLVDIDSQANSSKVLLHNCAQIASDETICRTILDRKSLPVWPAVGLVSLAPPFPDLQRQTMISRGMKSAGCYDKLRRPLAFCLRLCVDLPVTSVSRPPCRIEDGALRQAQGWQVPDADGRGSLTRQDIWPLFGWCGQARPQKGGEQRWIKRRSANPSGSPASAVRT